METIRVTKDRFQIAKKPDSPIIKCGRWLIVCGSWFWLSLIFNICRFMGLFDIKEFVK
jgi:hypothetical protein